MVQKTVALRIGAPAISVAVAMITGRMLPSLHIGSAILRSVFSFLIAVSLCVLGGCESAPRARELSGNRLDRLVATYPDLASGRFVVLADFDDAKHMQLAQVVRMSDRAAVSLDRTGGRAETGASCLRFRAGSDEDALVLSNAVASDWYMKRDWREYDLLLASLHAPRGGAEVELAIVGGEPERRLSAETTLDLRPGWNDLRIDLASIGEFLPLDDVRQIRVRFLDPDRRSELGVDDVILTSNREALFGDSSLSDGSLYVQKRGRRLIVGAGGSFKLTFAKGQITEWFDLRGEDPRERNLVRGTALGPTPVVLSSDESYLVPLMAEGARVVARQRLLEANRVRAVVEVDWTIAGDSQREQPPSVRWRYAVYFDGSLRVRCDADLAGALPPGRKLGVGVSLARPPAGIVVEESSVDGRALAVTKRLDGTGAGLAWVTSHLGEDASPIRAFHEPQLGKTTLVWTTESATNPRQSWASTLLLGRSPAEGENATPAGLGLVPPVVEILEGRRLPVSEFPELLDVEASQGRFRARADLPPYVCFCRVSGLDTGRVWVYVNQQLHRDWTRDASGRVLVALPPLDSRAVVEVLSEVP